jgi:hypothetical protein
MLGKAGDPWILWLIKGMSWLGMTRGVKLGGLGVRDRSSLVILLGRCGGLGCGVRGLFLVTWVFLRRRGLGLDTWVVRSSDASLMTYSMIFSSVLSRHRGQVVVSGCPQGNTRGGWRRDRPVSAVANFFLAETASVGIVIRGDWVLVWRRPSS